MRLLATRAHRKPVLVIGAIGFLFLLLASLLWVFNTRSVTAHSCGGGYHHNTLSSSHKCHKHCKNGMRPHNTSHGDNCSVSNPTPRPTSRPTRRPTSRPASTPTPRPLPTATPTPTPTPGPTPTPTATATPLVLGAPPLWVIGVTQTTVELGWTAVPGATGYELLYVSSHGHLSGAYLSATPPLDHTATNLLPATQYDFHLRATAGTISGPWSSVTATTLAPVPTPTPLATPVPTPAGTPAPITPGANWGRGDCGCTGGSLDRLRNSGIDWLDTAAFDTYAAAVCVQTSGPYFEARDFVTGWAVDPPQPTLHSQAVLSQSPGTSRYAIVASATAPRKAQCTAANVSAGEVPDVTTPALDCTGAQAHLGSTARAWIAGALQQSYPGSAVRGSGQHCTGTAHSLRTHFEQTNNELINPGPYETIVRVCYDNACHQTDVDDTILAVAIMIPAAVHR